jgi:hypothetical protein
MWMHHELASGLGIGLRTSIAFDRAERPSVAWINSTGIIKARFDSEPTEQLGTNAAAASPIVSLGYDLAGDMRGMYMTTSPGNLYGIGYDGGFDVTDMVTVDDGGEIADAAMVTDHRGLRHFAAREDLGGGSWALLLASETTVPNSGSSNLWLWSRPLIADSIEGVDVAVSPTDGKLAIAYTSENEGVSKLHYSKFNGFAFDTQTILSSSQESFYDVSLAFDFSDGRPAIAFERDTGSSDELHFAYLDGASSWQTTVVDDSISLISPYGYPRRPSLAFDDYGTSWPAIAYVDDDGSLNVAFDPPAPEPAAMQLLCIGLACARRRLRRSKTSPDQSPNRSEPRP